MKALFSILVLALFFGALGAELRQKSVLEEFVEENRSVFQEAEDLADEIDAEDYIKKLTGVDILHPEKTLKIGSKRNIWGEAIKRMASMAPAEAVGGILDEFEFIEECFKKEGEERKECEEFIKKHVDFDEFINKAQGTKDFVKKFRKIVKEKALELHKNVKEATEELKEHHKKRLGEFVGFATTFFGDEEDADKDDEPQKQVKEDNSEVKEKTEDGEEEKEFVTPEYANSKEDFIAPEVKKHIGCEKTKCEPKNEGIVYSKAPKSSFMELAENLKVKGGDRKWSEKSSSTWITDVIDAFNGARSFVTPTFIKNGFTGGVAASIYGVGGNVEAAYDFYRFEAGAFYGYFYGLQVGDLLGASAGVYWGIGKANYKAKSRGSIATMLGDPCEVSVEVGLDLKLFGIPGVSGIGFNGGASIAIMGHEYKHNSLKLCVPNNPSNQPFYAAYSVGFGVSASALSLPVGVSVMFSFGSLIPNTKVQCKKIVPGWLSWLPGSKKLGKYACMLVLINLGAIPFGLVGGGLGIAVAALNSATYVFMGGMKIAGWILDKIRKLFGK